MKFGIIGCGNMGKALAIGLSSHPVFLYNHNIKKAEILSEEGYGQVFKSLDELIDSSEILLLAIKPQNLKNSAGAIAEKLKEKQIVISLLAGTPLSTLKACFPQATIIRMMPNLAIQYGEGLIGLSASDDIKEEERIKFTKLFEILGKVYWIQEEKLEAITALAGSGPAFFFSMLEAMIESGTALGFQEKESHDLVLQMVKGALVLLEKSGQSLKELKKQIASPGGTTIEGLKKWEENAMNEKIGETFFAAYKRAKELSTS